MSTSTRTSTTMSTTVSTTRPTTRPSARPRAGRPRAFVVAFAASALAAGAAVMAAPTATAAPLASAPAGGFGVHQWAGPLVDLQPGVTDPFDAARARLVMVSQHGSTTAVLALTGVGAEAAGRTYGAHLHTGPCVEGNGAAAGPHYNDSTVRGVVPPVVGPSTEVWLDVTVSPAGTAVAVAHVPFVPQPGDRSVVVHAQATDDHGTAGARLACLPVSWS
jgi:Cu/Zn superoxide dismutase